MTIAGKLKEAAGYVKEETGELVGSPNMAQKGRDTRNEGRLEDGKMPKTTIPGTTGDTEEADDNEATDNNANKI